MDPELPRVLVPLLAAELGITRAQVRTQVRRGNWRSLARGAVLTRPEAPTRADWADLGLALAGPSGALSGWDAVRSYGLGARFPPPEQVLVLSRSASNRIVGRVRIRETARPYSVSYTSYDSGYPLAPRVGVARAVADTSLAAVALSAVRGLVTSAVQAGTCRPDQLVAELQLGPRNGSALLRRALADVLDGARSEAEAVAARLLARADVPAFELNVPIVDGRGRVLAVADVLWRALRSVLEIDSREYHYLEQDWKNTMARHNRLTRCGLAVTHYPPSMLAARQSEWLGEVRSWLVARAAELGVPWSRARGVIRASRDGPTPLRA